jgi:predicted ArsR family transcriptional regulator
MFKSGFIVRIMTVSSDGLREIVIDQDEQKQKALQMFSDTYTRVILSAMMEQPKSALQITEETKIPLTTVYRKLHHLLEENLIRISGQIAENGKKNFLYKSKLKSFHITFTKDRFAVLVNTSGTCNFCLKSHA